MVVALPSFSSSVSLPSFALWSCSDMTTRKVRALLTLTLDESGVGHMGVDISHGLPHLGHNSVLTGDSLCSMTSRWCWHSGVWKSRTILLLNIRRRSWRFLTWSLKKCNNLDLTQILSLYSWYYITLCFLQSLLSCDESCRTHWWFPPRR